MGRDAGMPTINVPADIVDDFIKVIETAATDPDTFHDNVGWRRYNDLLKRWLTAAGVSSPESWVSPPSVKSVIARLMMAKQGCTRIMPDQAHQVLIDTIADIRRGHGTPGSPNDQRWLVWGVFPNPNGEYTRQFVEGTGVISSPEVGWPMRMFRIDESILRITQVLDGPVDNRVGSPEVASHQGDWCLEYVYWGRRSDVWKPLQRWLEWATLWASEPPQWSAAFCYSLSLCKGDATQIHRNDTATIPGLVRIMRANNTVESLNQQFSNLWTFVDWVDQQLKQIPREDQRRIAVAMEILHQLMISRASSLFVVLSVMMAEALLGSDRELSRTMAQRIAWALYADDSAPSRWHCFQMERLLYDLRSQIVHGRVASNDVYQAYCRIAEDQKVAVLPVAQLNDTMLHRNRMLIIQALRISRSQPLTMWADQHLMT